MVYASILEIIVAVLFIKLFFWLWNLQGERNLPPGTMGYPIVGETWEFLKPEDFLQISSFVRKRMSRHGNLFRTSLFGQKVIISTDVQINLEIAKSNTDSALTKSILTLFGENNLFVQSKASHKRGRNLTFQLFGSQSLKLTMLQDIDVLAGKFLKLGAQNGSLDVKTTASKILIECLAKNIMGDMDHESLKKLLDCWNFFPTSGWFQLPLNIPGSRFYQLLQGRKRMMKILGDMVSSKIASGERVTDFMEIIFNEMGCQGESRSRSVEKAVEYIFSFFLVASETTPRFLAAILKLVSGNPRVQQELQSEHSTFTPVTWEDYKGMSFTHMVINEALRITSTGPTIFRRTSQDYQVGGYRIPKGWIFMGYPLVHFNEQYYEDAFVFNPSRCKGKELNATVTKIYMPFGAGTRLCLGAEFAKMQMALFIHHLSRYRWSMNGETTVLRRLLPIFPNDFIVRSTLSIIFSRNRNSMWCFTFTYVLM